MSISPAHRRLLKDFESIQKDPNPGISASPTDGDIFTWNAIIMGPPDTAYEFGTFRLKLKFSESYPLFPPSVQFIDKMFHPNIFENGKICIDILGSQWRPSYDVCAILTSIQSLIDSPEADRADNFRASDLYLHNRTQFDKIVKKTVEESWKEK